MWNKCKVVMLPTNEKANNKYSPDELLLCINTETKNVLKFGNNSPFDILGGYFKPQHLYFLSDEEIKEGDWYINTNINRVLQCTSQNIGVVNLFKQSKKIIATTDKSLGLNSLQEAILNNSAYESIKPKGLPQILQSFIEYFVTEYNKGNIITEVMVEYEPDRPKNSTHYAMGSFNWQLKTNTGNTINIKPIKDSWTREEVETLFRHFRTDILPFGQVNDYTLNKWIEENL